MGQGISASSFQHSGYQLLSHETDVNELADEVQRDDNLVEEEKGPEESGTWLRMEACQQQDIENLEQKLWITPQYTPGPYERAFTTRGNGCCIVNGLLWMMDRA